MSFTIKTKLFVNAGLVTLIVLLLIVMNALQTSNLTKLNHELIAKAHDNELAVQTSYVNERINAFIGDVTTNRNYETAATEWQKIKGESLKLVEELQKVVDTPEEKQWLSASKEALDQAIATYEGKYLPLVKSTPGTNPEIVALNEKIDKTLGIIDENTSKISESLKKDAQNSETAFTQGVSSSRRNNIIVGIIGIVLIIAFAGWIMGGILRPLNAMLAVVKDIAEGEGDLTKRLDDSQKDEIGEVSKWFNTFLDKLHGIISQVAQNSVQVASAASQLFSTSEQMATGTEEVAAQTGTVAAASEEMAATSMEIAQNCGMAADGSRLANDSALQGSTVVEETVAVMNRIAERVKESAQTVGSLGERSDQIGAIIGTIEDIADQTNLLALNAAIEAARAGEQGRGFAVVADEVRALAERTTKATREIGEMIKAIQSETKGAVGAMEEGVKEVEKGTAEAAKSGQALQDILNQINSVTMQVSQIATAAEQQTATTNEITNNIQQITQVVQDASNGAHESANAASQLATLAEDLQKLVRQFKLAA